MPELKERAKELGVKPLPTKRNELIDAIGNAVEERDSRQEQVSILYVFIYK